ncbi:MAG: hypothetical protein AAB263_01580, partial [Planctomycetota bacterium]
TGLRGVLDEVGDGARAVLLARSDEAADELRAHLKDAGIESRAEVVTGRVSGGWRDMSSGLIVVHDFELAERAPTRRRTGVHGGSPLDSLSDLRRGDLCVHLS